MLSVLEESRRRTARWALRTVPFGKASKSSQSPENKKFSLFVSKGVQGASHPLWTWISRRRTHGTAISGSSRRAPHRLGGSGPRSAGGQGRICLSPLRQTGTEECPPRADAISFYGRFFAGPARRSDELPRLQSATARRADRNVARSG